MTGNRMVKEREGECEKGHSLKLTLLKRKDTEPGHIQMQSPSTPRL